jgi:acyl-coenzyme A synthetase/AMP-(fatty) acid ligase
MRSLVDTGIFQNKDTIVQTAACTFDVHIKQILGALILNATLIMLRPHNNMDFEYLAQTLQNKQVTCMQCVPTFLNSFYNFIESNNAIHLTTIRSLCCGG